MRVYTKRKKQAQDAVKPETVRPSRVKPFLT
jgi:hypothetical protein